MHLRALIFDLDGTLLDTLQDIGTSCNRVLAARGFPTHEIETYRMLIGDGAPECVKQALPAESRSEALIQECLEAYFEEYERSWNVSTRPFDGIPELLDDVTDRGIGMAVLSNKSQLATERCVNGLLGRWMFAPVIGQDAAGRRKPDPAGALEIAESLNVSPGECLFVGDTEVDTRTAEAAGMFPLGVLWGYRTARELRTAGARALVREPSEILELILGDRLPTRGAAGT